MSARRGPVIGRRGMLAAGGIAILAAPGRATMAGGAVDPATGLVLDGAGRIDVRASGRALQALSGRRAGGSARAGAMLAALARVRHCSAMRGAGGYRGHFYALLDRRTLTRADGAIVDFAASDMILAGARAAAAGDPRLASGATALLRAVDPGWVRPAGARGWSPEIGFV